MVPKKEKDIDYYNAINIVKNLDIDIKKEEEILNNLKHLRTLSLHHIMKHENWINDLV